MAGVTPVTVLTGFPGSGKTTLLRRLVSDPRFGDTALVLDARSEPALEHPLARSAAHEALPLAGCPCCRFSGDVVRALRELHFDRLEGRVPAFTRAVVETDGLADPGPLLATVAQWPLVAARYAVQGLVCAMHAREGLGTLDRYPEAARQVAMADRVVVTHCDLAAPGAIATLEACIARLAPGATLLRADAAFDVGRLVDAGLYRGGGATDASGWLRAGEWRVMAPASHAGGFAAFTWTDQEPRPWSRVEPVLAALVARHGERLLRLKGLVNAAGEPGPRAVQAVGHTLYPSARLPSWPDADRSTRLHFVGRGLEERDVASMLTFHPHDPSRPR